MQKKKKKEANTEKKSSLLSHLCQVCQVSSQECQVKVKSSLLPVLVRQVTSPQISHSSPTPVKSCDLSPIPLIIVVVTVVVVVVEVVVVVVAVVEFLTAIIICIEQSLVKNFFTINGPLNFYEHSSGAVL